MALTGLQILKLLPKTNCKECGCNTCLAFAMKLAAKKADLAECPYASEEARQVLGAAAEPPVRGIGLGPDQSVRLGEETVLYRHERTFVHRPAVAVNVNDTDPPQSVDAALRAVADYVLTRVGEEFRVDLVAVTQRAESASQFVALAQKAWKATGRGLVLRGRTADAVRSAAVAVAGSHSLLCAPDADAAEVLWPVAKEHEHALAVTAADLDSLAELTARIKQAGFNDLVLQFQTHSPAEAFQTNSIARRAALRDNFKPLGYPTLRFIDIPLPDGRGSAAPGPDDDLLEATVQAVTEIDKYGGIVVLPGFDPAQLAALMTLRLNIYTDPQKPIQVEPKVYPIGEPTADSPIFVTTNFSLTYFIVSGEIENCGISAWLVVPECEGMSVLTAWAAGKFNGQTIAKFIKEIGLEGQVRRRQLIIPGYVAQISGELEENLPGWQVVVGPQEAADLEGFVKAKVA